jgi:hypothetical protein
METAAVSGRDKDHGMSDDDVVAVAAAPEKWWAAFGDFYRIEHRRMVHVALLLTGSSDRHAHVGGLADHARFLLRDHHRGRRSLPLKEAAHIRKQLLFAPRFPAPRPADRASSDKA